MRVFKRQGGHGFDVKISGQRIRRSGFASEAAAREAAEKLLDEVAAGERWLDVADDYLEALELARKRPRTVESARSTVNAASEVWGDASLAAVATEEGLASFARARLSVSPATLARDFRVLGAIFRRAEKQGWLPACPELPKVRLDAPEPVTWTREELQRLVEHGGPIRELLLAATKTGARAGELRLLQWGDVEGLGGPEPALVFRKTKTRRDRRVACHAELAAALLALGPGAPEEYVFKSASGGPWSPSALSVHAAAACRLAGLKKPGAKPLHSIRASVATLLVENGASLEVVRAVCGWASLACLPHYVVARAGQQRQAVEKL